MLKRILASTVLIVSFFLLPYWITLALGVVFLFVFRNYWEIIPIFFFADLVYSIPQPRFGDFEYILTLFAVLLYLVVYLLRKNLLHQN